MKTKNILLRGALIFGFIGFFIFVILIISGMFMSAFGLTCICYKVFSWSLIGVGVISALFLWYGCCCKKEIGDGCKGIQGTIKT